MRCFIACAKTPWVTVCTEKRTSFSQNIFPICSINTKFTNFIWVIIFQLIKTTYDRIKRWYHFGRFSHNSTGLTILIIVFDVIYVGKYDENVKNIAFNQNQEEIIDNGATVTESEVFTCVSCDSKVDPTCSTNSTFETFIDCEYPFKCYHDINGFDERHKRGRKWKQCKPNSIR